MTLYDLITAISPVINDDPNIHTMWLEGSWATGKNNDESDIDVWLDVKDGTFDDSIDVFRAALMHVGEIDWEKSRGVYSETPKLQKHTFHLKGFSEPQCIELDLQEHSRNYIFDPKQHFIKIIFDKDQTIHWKN